MKKYINGKSYDTDTATQVGSYSNSGTWRDFSHVEETLYRKRTGEYFVFGEGGPMTKYAKSTGCNSWSGGSQILPMTYDGAKKWAEEHLDTSDFDAEFGVIEDDESRETVTLSFSSSAAALLRRRAQESGQSLSGYIAALIQ